MPMYLRFLAHDTTGQLAEALGSDGTFPNVGNIPFHKLHARALQHAKSPAIRGKGYVGYRFLTGRSLLTADDAGLKDVLFTKKELAA